jgi:hypothetical protein
MRRATAAEYLDISPASFDLLNMPCVRLNARGDRMYAKEDVDTYVERLRARPILMDNEGGNAKRKAG